MSRHHSVHPRQLLAMTVLAVLAPGPLAAVEPDYAQVMQTGLAFLEINEAGRLSPLNRFTAWRGESCMDDGADVGLDLTGGWYDAGDHLKMNNTMAKAGSHLAWSVITFHDQYDQYGQMPYVLNSLRHVTDYFSRCINDPKPDDPDDFSGYEFYVDIGSQTYDPSDTSTNISPTPKAHSVWCPAEVINGYTARQTCKVNASNPNSAACGSMAATLAAASLVFERYGTEADKALAATYRAQAIKLAAFGRSDLVADGTALNAKGEKVLVANLHNDNAMGADNLIWAELWLHELAKELDADYDDSHIANARDVLAAFLDAQEQYEWLEFAGWWKADHFNHHSLMLWLQSGDATPDEIVQFEDLLVKMIDRWSDAETGVSESPHGLHYKNNVNAFLIHRVIRSCALASMYAHYTTDTAKRDEYIAFAESQMEYILGDNAQGKSFLIGYGDHVEIHHHRQAHGTWDGNQYWDKSDYFMPRMRHVAYGALLGGPKRDDSYTVDEDADFINVKRCEPVISEVGHLQITAAYMASLDPDAYSVDPDFPAPDVRNFSDDPEWTDHDIYVAARVDASSDDSLTLETTLYNRSSWPARIMTDGSYRYYFTADDGETEASDFTVTVTSSDGGEAGDIVHVRDDLFYAEVRFPGETIMPNRLSGVQYWRKAARMTITAKGGTFDPGNDHSGADLPTGSDQKVVLAIPVYEGGTLEGGTAPAQDGATRHISLTYNPAPGPDFVLDSSPAATIEDEGAGTYQVQTLPATTLSLWLQAAVLGEG